MRYGRVVISRIWIEKDTLKMSVFLFFVQECLSNVFVDPNMCGLVIVRDLFIAIPFSKKV